MVEVTAEFKKEIEAIREKLNVGLGSQSFDIVLRATADLDSLINSMDVIIEQVEE